VRRGANEIAEEWDLGVGTAAFRGYVSGYATVSGAASAVLGAFFPDRADELQAGMKRSAGPRRLSFAATARSRRRRLPDAMRSEGGPRDDLLRHQPVMSQHTGQLQAQQSLRNCACNDERRERERDVHACDAGWTVRANP
jgi:hypothetical protein